MNSTKRIQLISGPRNVSTALMYSFANRSDTEVVDEPFYGYYLQQTGKSHPGREQVLQAQNTDPKDVIEKIIMGDCSKPVLFIKNMAHHLVGVDADFLNPIENVFLIRNPDEMLTSLIKTIPEPTVRDTAYRQQYDLFEKLREARQETPVVIDSRHLLLDPSAVLKKLCRRLDIPFQKQMLKWEAGSIPEDGVWAEYWYDNVHRSTGFKPYESKNEAVPQHLSDLLEKCQFYYNKLEKFAIKAN